MAKIDDHHTIPTLILTLTLNRPTAQQGRRSTINPQPFYLTFTLAFRERNYPSVRKIRAY